MNFTKKPMLLVLIATAIAALAFASYWVMSKNKAALFAASHYCVAGAPNCSPTPAASSHNVATSPQSHEIICAPDDQSCDLRSQASRTIAYRNLRDRHAERD